MNLQATILYSEQKFWFFWPAWCKFSNSVCLVLWWKLSLLWDILKKTSFWGELNETRIFKVSSNLLYWDWKRKPFPLLCNTFLCFSREGHIHRSSILVCLSKGVTVDFCCENISANLFCPCCPWHRTHINESNGPEQSFYSLPPTINFVITNIVCSLRHCP